MENDCYNWVGCTEECEKCPVHQKAVDDYNLSELGKALKDGLQVVLPLGIAKTALVECRRGRAYGSASIIEKAIRAAESRRS